MNPLLAIVLAIAAIGALLLAVERHGGPRLRKVGPWLVVSLAASCVGLGTWLSHGGFSTWRECLQTRELMNLAGVTGFLALFASEAALMGRWLLRPGGNPWLSLATFTLGTSLAWFVTFLVLLAVVPGS